jgi:hypothetical protein
MKRNSIAKVTTLFKGPRLIAMLPITFLSDLNLAVLFNKLAKRKSRAAETPTREHQGQKASGDEMPRQLFLKNESIDLN